MKNVLYVLIMASVAYCRGGDTLAFAPAFQSFQDGDTMFASTHFHSPHDSTQSVINGRLGNINLAADADIDPTKIDTSKYAKRSRVEYLIVADSIRAFGPLKGNVTGNLTGTADSAKGAHHLTGGAVNADSLNVHGTVIRKDGKISIGASSFARAISINNGTSEVILGHTGNVGLVGTETAHAMGISTNGNVRQYIDANGLVGIGTSSPTNKLTVSGGIKADTVIAPVITGSVTGKISADTLNIGKLWTRSYQNLNITTKETWSYRTNITAPIVLISSVSASTDTITLSGSSFPLGTSVLFINNYSTNADVNIKFISLSGNYYTLTIPESDIYSQCKAYRLTRADGASSSWVIE
jgi:hypothetical protein